ncbi:MAG: glycosyltransferase family 39 protein [Vicinamibacteria bacterium]|nr:glycosyltransferase family 39 protein [Vicinamibacteria bacterium]
MKRWTSVVMAGTFVFVLSLLVRGLYLADGMALLYTPDQDGTRMARRYDDTALSILAGEGILFPKVWDPARTGLASRPPGYGLFLASVYQVFGRSFPIVAAVQDVLTSMAVLLVMAFAFRLFGLSAALFSGLLVAVSPHIAATSNLVLADAVASLPLLLAFLVVLPVIRGSGSPSNQIARLVLMGVLIGAGVWIRPNVVLLGPFTAPFLFFLLGRNRRALLLSGLVALVSLLVVSPITLRNWLVFGEFVPVSINGGITLWQGVADAGGREYGARVWDKQVMAEEAERYGRPDYLLWWAEPDGIVRDRDRYRRATDVIKDRPLWYARAMLRRMGMMLLFTDGPKSLLPAGAIVKAADGERVPLRPMPGLDATVDEAAFAEKAGVASFLRAPLRALHGAWFVVPILAWVGIVLSLRDAPRATLLWLVVPLYYLAFESPFLYEWRVAVPMQYFLLPFAGRTVADLLAKLAPR